MTLEIRAVSSDETRPIRHKVLRQNQPLESCVYPGDDGPRTVHLGAFLDGELVGCTSLYNEAPPGEKESGAWRIRGMATFEEVRGAGYGRKLLRACIDHAESKEAVFMWCNARTPAAGLYAGEGFVAEGDEFELPDIGPHFFMRKRMNAAG